MLNRSCSSRRCKRWTYISLSSEPKQSRITIVSHVPTYVCWILAFWPFDYSGVPGVGERNSPLLHSGWASRQSQNLMKKVIERSSSLIQAKLSPHVSLSRGRLLVQVNSLYHLYGLGWSCTNRVSGKKRAIQITGTIDLREHKREKMCIVGKNW